MLRNVSVTFIHVSHQQQSSLMTGPTQNCHFMTGNAPEIACRGSRAVVWEALRRCLDDNFELLMCTVHYISVIE